MSDTKRCIKTSTRSCWHCMNKCYQCFKALDKASKGILCVAGGCFLVILICVFVVGNTPQIDHNTIQNNSNHIQNDPMGSDGVDSDNDNNEEMPEFITIDNLYKPVVFPLHDETKNGNDIDDDMNHDANNVNNEPKYGEWYNVDNFDWTDYKIKRFAQNKKIKISEGVTKRSIKIEARIKSIDTRKNKIIIEKLGGWFGCLFRCEQEIDFKSSKLIYFEFEDEQASSSGFDVTEIIDGIAMKLPDIIHDEMKTNEENLINKMKEIIHDEIHEQMEDMKGQQEEFKDDLNDKFEKINGNVKNNSDEIAKLNERVNSIVSSIAGNKNITINQTIDWDKIDQYIDNKIDVNSDRLNKMESAIKELNNKFDEFDDKIESAVRRERDDQFDNLAHKIAQEIADGMQDYPIYNDDIIRPNDNHMYISNGDDKVDKDDKYESSENCVSRIVNHSTAKYETEYGDPASKLGWWWIRKIFKIYDQSAIQSSNRLGECIPLLIPYNGDDPHIIIELYQPTQVKTISYYHSHSKQLGEAINAAPKEFSIWGGQHIMGPFYNLGEFTYDYYSHQHTQYFNVNTNNHDSRGIENEIIQENDDNVVDGIPSYVDDDVMLHDEQDDDDQDGIEIDDNGDIVNGTFSGDGDDDDNIFRYIAFKLKSTNGQSDYGCIYQIKVFGDPIFSS